MRVLAFLIFIMSLSTAVGAGKLSWLGTSCDLGEILESNGKVLYAFRAVNLGDSPVVILRARPSCGCLVSDYPRQAIEPGDTAVVNVIFNPTGYIGEFVNFVAVTTDAAPHRTELRIKGKVIGLEMTINEQYPIAIGSLRINAGSVPFGKVVEGDKSRATIEVYNSSNCPMKYYVRNVPRWLKVRPSKTVVEPQSVGIISIELDAGKCNERGYIEGTFDMFAEPVKHGAGALAGIKKIDVMAVIEDDFSAWSKDEIKNAPKMQLDADRIVFADIDVHSSVPVTQRLSIINRGIMPLKIYGVRQAEDCIEVQNFKNEIEQGDTANIEVAIFPDKVKDKILNTSIMIYSNDPQSPSVLVRIVGNIKP